MSVKFQDKLNTTNAYIKIRMSFCTFNRTRVPSVCNVIRVRGCATTFSLSLSLSFE